MNHSNEQIFAPFEEGTFTKAEEKMVIELTLKVLQNQQVSMNQGHPKKHHDSYE